LIDTIANILMTFWLSFKVLRRHGFAVIHAANAPDLFCEWCSYRTAHLVIAPNEVQDGVEHILCAPARELALGRRRIEEELNWDLERSNLLLAYTLLSPLCMGGARRFAMPAMKGKTLCTMA
jgi:hypothetical protein